MPVAQAAAANERIAALLRRAGESGLTVGMIAARLGMGPAWVRSVIVSNPDLFEKTGRACWKAPYWRVRTDHPGQLRRPAGQDGDDRGGETDEDEDEISQPETEDFMAEQSQGLWGAIDVKVVGVTGEHASGKSLFISTIDPTHMRLYDHEHSTSGYLGLGYKSRVDVPGEMVKWCERNKKLTYSPIDTFEWWLKDIEQIKPGEYTVIGYDPINDLEQGLVDFVRANPGKFGKTANQYEKSVALLMGDAKAYWKQILATLAAKCQTFAFTTHMGDEFKGAAPTGKRKAKGKTTLSELASLYIQLERRPDETGKIPAKPSGILLKSRLAHTAIVDGEPQVVSILPPRLPEATPKAIRAYIAKPCDLTKLKAGEKLVEHKPTDAEKAEQELLLAETKRQAEELRLEQMRLMERAGEMQREGMRAVLDRASDKGDWTAVASITTISDDGAVKVEVTEPVAITRSEKLAEEKPADKPAEKPADPPSPVTEEAPFGMPTTHVDDPLDVLRREILEMRHKLCISQETWDKNMAKLGLVDLSEADETALKRVHTGLSAKLTGVAPAKN